MAESEIEWTDRVWNLVAGCSPVSEGCRHCYAAKHAIRLAGNPHPAVAAKYAGTAEMRGAGAARRAVFTGRVNVDEGALLKPLQVRKPALWFVNSMSDLFHPTVPFDVVDRAFAVMALCPQHTFQVLTKRPERMTEYLEHVRQAARGFAHGPSGYLAGVATDAGLVTDEQVHPRFDEAVRLYKPHVTLPPTSLGDAMCCNPGWPLPNVWLGTSVEDQAAADKRIPHLLRCPAAVRFLSCEPLLGPIEFPVGMRYLRPECEADPAWRAQIQQWRGMGLPTGHFAAVNWVIAGGESGPGARPMQPDWARSLRDQCVAAGVPFFFKQWGEWRRELHACKPGGDLGGDMRADRVRIVKPVGLNDGHFRRGDVLMRRVGKSVAGRLLDGREWNEMPVAPLPAPAHG